MFSLTTFSIVISLAVLVVKVMIFIGTKWYYKHKMEGLQAEIKQLNEDKHRLKVELETSNKKNKIYEAQINTLSGHISDSVPLDTVLQNGDF